MSTVRTEFGGPGGEAERSPKEAAVRALLEKGLTVAVAESCTGGLVSARLVDVPGASKVFLEGQVTYSNEAKIRRLGVSPETLSRFGAVSAETAREMAEGLRKASGADIAVSTTGIAGPDGGTAEKPVGLVYVGCATAKGVTAEELRLSGDRAGIRSRAADRALHAVRRAALSE